MTGPRRKRFGPLLYATIALSVVAVVITKGMEYRYRSSAAAPISRPVAEIAADLNSSDELARARALDELGREGEATAVPVWLEVTRMADPAMRKLACEALVRMKADPGRLLPALVDLADDPSEDVRVEAARGLSRLREFADRQSLASLDEASLSTAMAALHKLAKDKDPAARFAGVRGLILLGRSDDPEIASVVLEAAADADLAEPRAELVGLVKQARPDLVGAILPGLQALLAIDDPVILFTTLDALAELGPSARPILPSLIEREASEDPLVRAAALFARAAIEGAGTSESVAILTKVLADDAQPFDRRQQALARLRQNPSAALSGATPSLIRGLTNPSPTIRQETLSLLQEILLEQPAELPSVFQNP